MAVVTPLLVLYAQRIAKKAAELTKYPLTEEQLKQLDRLVPMAVAYVDERVHKFLRGLVKEAPKTSDEKQALALRVLRTSAPDGFDKLPDATLKIAVDAAVHDRRVSIPSAALSFPPPPSSYPPPTLPPVIAPPKRAP
jgi:hypothetical protein